MNILIAFFIRLLETLFLIGAIGCILAVIPITAQRLLMVLFEPAGSEESAVPATDSQRQAA